MSPDDPRALAYAEGIRDQSKGLDLSKCPYLDQPGKEIEHRFYVDGWLAGVQVADMPKSEGEIE